MVRAKPSGMKETTDESEDNFADGNKWIKRRQLARKKQQRRAKTQRANETA